MCALMIMEDFDTHTHTHAHLCKDGSDRLMKHASLYCACCYLLEVSPVPLVVLAICLALFFSCDTHSYSVAKPYICATHCGTAVT